jgi:hypothetical protein
VNIEQTDDNTFIDVEVAEDTPMPYYMKLCSQLNRVNINVHNPKHFPNHQESLLLMESTDVPFRGLTEDGTCCQTYNTNGNWENILSVTEMIMHFAPGNPRLGRTILEDKIKDNPEVVKGWMKNVRSGIEEEYSIFQFSYDSKGNFKLIKKAMKKHHDTHIKDLAKPRKKVARVALKIAKTQRSVRNLTKKLKGLNV